MNVAGALRITQPSVLYRLVPTRRVSLLLAFLPIAYVDNPIIRFYSVADDSPISYVPVAILIGIAFAAGISGMLTGSVRRGRHGLDGPVMAVGAVAVVWALIGIIRGNPPFYIVDDLFQIIEFCVFYLAVTTLVREVDDIIVLLKGILILTLISALFDFVVAFHTWNPARDGFPRIFPDGIRALPALILPVVLSAVVFARRGHRLWLGLSLGVIVVWTIASLTRGLWFANVVSIAVLLIAAGTGKERWRIARGLALAIAAVAVLSVPALILAQQRAPHLLDYLEFRVVYTPQQLFNPANRTQARRELEVVYVLDDLMRSPITMVFGEGLGATYLGDTGYSAATLTFGPRHFIHDSYLAYWFRMGLPGLLAYLLLAWRFFAEGLRRSRAGPSLGRGVVLGLVASYAGVLAYSITSDSLLRHPTDLFIGAAMAFVTVLEMHDVRRQAKDMLSQRPVGAKAAADVAVTVISNNHRDLLSKCVRTTLESIEASGCKAEVWVLDNDSTDGSAEMLNQSFPSVHVLRRSTRQGFAKNQNELFEVSVGRADAVLLLNDDVELPRDTIGRLLGALNTSSSIAAVGPTLTFPDGRFQTAGEFLPTWGYHVGRHLGLGHLAPPSIRMRLGQMRNGTGKSPGLLDVGYLSGACLLISSNALREIGPFDERFGMYSEDADWCKRAQDEGWRVCVVTQAAAIHHRNQSWSRLVATERERSMYRYLRKHGTPSVNIAVLKAIVVVAYTFRITLLRLAIAVGLKRMNVDTQDRLLTYRSIVALSFEE